MTDTAALNNDGVAAAEAEHPAGNHPEEALDQVLFQADVSQFQAFEKLLSQPLTDNPAVQRLLASRSPWD